MNAVITTTPTVTRLVDHDLARSWIVEQWGDDAIVIAGKAHRTAEMSLLCAQGLDGRIDGIAYYRMNGMIALLGAIIVRKPAAGVGKALFDEVVAEARRLKLRKLRAITTNDNLDALRFYQRRGMRLMTLFAGGVDAYRAFRPGLKTTGEHDIPLRDVIELEMDL
jgi:GNAT superfamily N-acetyltransferase